MSGSSLERAFLLFFRWTMAWTFLYAASHQVFDPSWSVAGFLSHTRTFHAVYAPLASATWAPVITFLVEYGHLLIGLSLLVGLMVRVSAAFGVLLMLLYWTAHMNWPYISNTEFLIVDYHIVYAGILGYLVLKHAGHVFGFDSLAEKLEFFENHPGLKPLVA